MAWGRQAKKQAVWEVLWQKQAPSEHGRRKLTHPWMVRVGVPRRNCLSLDFREKTKPGGEIWGAEEKTGKTVFSSVHSVVSSSLRPHGLQHARLPWPSPTPRACSDSSPSSRVMPSNHLILCHPLLLPSVFPSVTVFSNESVLWIRWPKYWSFSVSPSNEYLGLISFRIDWFDLVIHETLKSLLQHHSWKANLVLSFLYGPALTSIHDYWKNHSFD